MKKFIKIFWINCIAVGIITLVFQSCDVIKEYNLKTNFIYKNKVSENIEIILLDENNVSFNNYIIEPNKELNVLIERDGAQTGIGQPFRLRNDSRYIAKKVIIKFIVSNKCLSFSEAEGVLDVRKYDNFSESMYNTSNNTLIYNIDSVELNNATTCL